mgnify:CR=1 FL=1|jgi:hypothetical protein
MLLAFIWRTVLYLMLRRAYIILKSSYSFALLTSNNFGVTVGYNTTGFKILGNEK